MTKKHSATDYELMEMKKPFIETVAHETQKLSIFGLLKQRWKRSLLFTFISMTEVGLLAYGLTRMETFYQDYDEGNNPFKSFSLNILIPLIGSKILDSIKTALITQNASSQTMEISETLTNRYFFSEKHYTDDEKEISRLIFNNFDHTRSALMIVHTDIIFKFFEMIIYGGTFTWTEKCQLRDIGIIGSISFSGAILILWLEYMGGHIKKIRQEYTEKHADTHEDVANILSNYETIQIYGIKNKLIKDISKRLYDLTKTLDLDTYRFSLAADSIDLILMGGMACVSMALASWQKYNSIRFLYLFMFSLQQSKNLKTFTKASYCLIQAGSVFKKIEKYLNTHASEIHSHALSNSPNHITVNNVKYSNRFSDLSFTINRGDKVIIEGPPDCGKSALLKLLVGLDTPGVKSGNITVDNIPLSSISNLRKYLTYVPVAPQIFPCSLIENIQIAHVSSLSEIHDASKKAGLNTEIESDEYNDIEAVRRLSLTQKKKIGLARLFLKLTPIIFLHEPLANLNNPTDFLDNLYEICTVGKKTLLIIENRKEFKEHRISQLFNKRILFMDSGEIRLFEYKSSSSEEQGEKIGLWESKNLDF